MPSILSRLLKLLIIRTILIAHNFDNSLKTFGFIKYACILS